MLPCQTNCTSYQAGCHKTCPFWQAFQAEQRAQREAKKRYLRYHADLCAQTTRQLRAMQARHLSW